MCVASDFQSRSWRSSVKRFRSLGHCVIGILAAGAWSHTAAAQPRAEPAANRDVDAKAAEQRRKAWMLSLEGVTHAPIDMGLQLGLETPQGVRVFAGYGWVPGRYMNLLTGIAANASSSPYAQTLLDDTQYRGRTWRLQAGFRPFRAIGLYADVGYAQVNADGSLDLASSSIPQLAALGASYHPEVAVGPPTACLLEYAAAVKPDLIVLGSRRPRGVPGLRSRVSVAKLLDRLTISLLVVPYPPLRS